MAASSGPAFTAANVESVVTAFYHGGASAQQQQQHNEWLTRSQLCPEAWSFGWELISPTKNPEVQYFGANTIATKVSKCLQEVPEAQLPALRQKLLDVIISYAVQGPKVVLTRLLVAMASLLIQTLPHHWERPVADLMELFQKEMSTKGLGFLSVLLEVLTIVPEELTTTAMPQARRTLVKASLQADVRPVLDLLNKVLSEPGLDTEPVLQAIKCLQAWVQFGISVEDTEPLFDRLMGKLQEDELFDASLDTMCTMISHPETHKYAITMRRILERVLQLEPLLQKMMAEEAYEMVTPLASLFVTFGESHSRMLIDWSLDQTSPNGKAAALGLITTIFSISACPAQFPVQETVSEMPFGFWYIFQDDIIACEPPQYQTCVSFFGGVYHKLVDALLKKSMYPLNDQHWTVDQKEAFRCYRTDIADTIMYCFNILRDNLLHQLLDHLDNAIAQCNANNAQNWPYLEACLYAWSAIGESLADEEDCDLLPRFLAKLPLIPYNNNVRVISSTLDCIGGFSEWLANFPHLVQHVIPIVTAGLTNVELSLYATMALKDMARDCTDALKPYAQDVLTACQQALTSNQLKPSECIRLMYPIGKVLNGAPKDQIMVKLQPIIMPTLLELQTQAGQEPNPQNKIKVVTSLKMLTTLFQALDTSRGGMEDKAPEAQQVALADNNAVAVLFPQLLPLAKSLSLKWISDPDVMNTIWNFLKQSSVSLQEHLQNYSGAILELLLHCYNIAPHETALELARLLLTALSRRPENRPMLVQLYMTLCTKTLSYIQSVGTMSDHADLIAPFFQVMGSTMKKDPSIFEQGGADVAALIQCACFCLSMPELGPVKYACSFLSNFIMHSRDSPYFLSLINSMGEQIFRQTIVNVGGDTSNRGFIDYYVDIVLAFIKKYFDNLCAWFNNMIREDDFPSSKITRQQKEEFARTVLRERANKRKLLEVLREFSMSCSGLISIEEVNRIMASWDRVVDHQAAVAAAKAAQQAQQAAQQQQQQQQQQQGGFLRQ